MCLGVRRNQAWPNTFVDDSAAEHVAVNALLLRTGKSFEYNKAAALAAHIAVSSFIEWTAYSVRRQHTEFSDRPARVRVEIEMDSTC
ncbi:hypothetical protein MSIMFI_03435 [Mycobacterium simulans]|nr:hypothetical protein MSIMFI_03435 [Mycobacterium simulans]